MSKKIEKKSKNIENCQMFALTHVDVQSKTEFLQKITEIMKNKPYDNFVDLMINTCPLSFDVIDVNACTQQIVTMNNCDCEDDFLEMILNEVKRYDWKEINYVNKLFKKKFNQKTPKALKT